MLINVTAACSPLVYRGGVFPLDYNQDVFVCVPEANLIKRNKLTFYGDSISAKQVYQGEEFLASLDEGFRPVNLAIGPDGSMYVVDMHRGVLGHHAYLSPYFKKKAKEMQIDTLVNYGRILKINSKANINPFNKAILSREKLILALHHKNGWIRDKAQQKLIDVLTSDEVKLLKSIVLSEEKSVGQLHALYVLEGAEQLNFEFLERVIKKGDSKLVAHALSLLEGYITLENKTRTLVLFESLLGRDNRVINLYLASTLGSWAKLSEEDFFPLIVKLWRNTGNNQILREALLSGLSGKEEQLLGHLNELGDISFTFLIDGLSQVVENKKENRKNRIYTN